MNVVNVIKMQQFTTYANESKGLVNVVNVVRGFFASSCTWYAKSELNGPEPDVSDAYALVLL